jgi:hypothetical protein
MALTFHGGDVFRARELSLSLALPFILQIKVTYLPEGHVADLEPTLMEGDMHVQTSNESAEVWSVRLEGLEPPAF